MRRGCSSILFVIGGWILSSVCIVGLIPMDEEISAWALTAIFAAFALPFLLVGTWISPGRRLAELGLTLMLAAGAGALMLVTMAAIWFDDAFRKLMPDLALEINFNPVMIVSLISIGGAGYWLWRRSSAGN